MQSCQAFGNNRMGPLYVHFSEQTIKWGRNITGNQKLRNLDKRGEKEQALISNTLGELGGLCWLRPTHRKNIYGFVRS